jgi:hypothetical protein
MKKYFTLLLLLFSISLFSQSTEGQNNNKKAELKLFALIHTDLIYDMRQMDPDWIGGFRPSKIPIYNTDPGWGSNGNTYFSLRQSTFKFDGKIPTQHRWGPVKLHFSFDFFGTGIHAGETAFRLRLVYGSWGPWLFGKQISTITDFDAMPNNWDWWGPSGMALLFTPMIRYTHDFTKSFRLESAIEMPGSEIDPGQLRQIDPALINVRTKEILPDFITRLTMHGDWGHIKGAVLLRQLSYEIVSVTHDTFVVENEFGWALNFSGVFNMFDKKSALKLQSVFGHGYAGFNNDGGVEIAPDSFYNAVVPFQYGFVAGFDQTLGKKFSASVVYSESVQDNSDGQTFNAFHRSQYFIGQLIYNFDKKFSLGLSYQYGRRFNKNGDNNFDHRIMFSARYLFNNKYNF